MSRYRKTVDEAALTLTIERRFAAARQVLWDYYTKRELLEQWWGPEGFPTTITSFDFRVGGRWHYRMTGPDGTRYWSLAEYTVIDPVTALEYQDFFSDESGSKSAELPATRVRVGFQADGGETLVTARLKFSNLDDLKKLVEMGFEEGFASQCDKLDRLLAGSEGATPRITVEATVSAPIAQVWRAYTTPEDIIQWNAASDDWHTPRASVDLRVGGRFCSRMEAKDGSMGFDFEGVYTELRPYELIEYAFGDRTARIDFAPDDEGVTVRVSFDAENTLPLEQQRDGWQAILDNFKRHVESV